MREYIMKLIPRSVFDNLRLNDEHTFDSDTNGDTKVVKIYRNDQLIAKKKQVKRKTQYFGVKGCESFLTEDETDGDGVK